MLEDYDFFHRLYSKNKAGGGKKEKHKVNTVNNLAISKSHENWVSRSSAYLLSLIR